MQKFTSLSERSQQQADATKKTNPDELSDNELLRQANGLEAEFLSVESINNSLWVNSKKRPSHNREENKGRLEITEKFQAYLVCIRINFSAVSRLVFFVKTKLTPDTNSLRTVHSDTLNRVALCFFHFAMTSSILPGRRITKSYMMEKRVSF